MQPRVIIESVGYVRLKSAQNRPTRIELFPDRLSDRRTVITFFSSTKCNARCWNVSIVTRTLASRCPSSNLTPVVCSLRRSHLLPTSMIGRRFCALSYIGQQHSSTSIYHSYIRSAAASALAIYYTTRYSEAAAQCIVIGPVWGFVCVFVCLWVCYRDNSKLRVSIFTKLGF